MVAVDRFELLKYGSPILGEKPLKISLVLRHPNRTTLGSRYLLPLLF
jgi:hypothetical protein